MHDETRAEQRLQEAEVVLVGLAEAEGTWLRGAVADLDGVVYHEGRADQPFTLALTAAACDIGREALALVRAHTGDDWCSFCLWDSRGHEVTCPAQALLKRAEAD